MLSLLLNSCNGYARFTRTIQVHIMTREMCVGFADPEPGSSPELPRNFRDKGTTSNLSDTLEEILTKKLSQKRQPMYFSGYDGRNHVPPNDSEMIFNITRFMYQMELLRILENQSVSIPQKQAAIANYEKTAQNTSYLPQLENGGLWKHWCSDENDKL